MISTDAASLAISLAKGLIKLGGRIDVLLAEKTAVTSAFAIPVPAVAAGPSMAVIRKELKAYLEETSDDLPDPLGSDRKRLAKLLDQTPLPDAAGDFYLRLFPSKAAPALIDPDELYVKELRARMPALDWSDDDTLKAAFFLASGRDERQLGYSLRLGLLVVDVLAEFGAENTALFTRDPRASAAVHAILERLAKPDLESFSEWSPLLRHVLSSTLNGLLDSRGLVGEHNPWLDGLLLALAQAREEAEGGDDFLVGLLQGRGYQLLVSHGLSIAAEKLEEGDAPVFRQIAADLLLAAAPLVHDNKKGFADFFNEHWSDLLRAGLQSVEKHGSVLLAEEDPLLKEVLLGLVHELASTSNAQWMTPDMIFHLADSAIGIVASHSDLWKPALREPWLVELVSAAADTIGAQGIRRSFSKPGLEAIYTHLLAHFAAHPELLVTKPGLKFDLVSGILKAVSAAGPLNAQTLASAAIATALHALGQRPALIDSHYGGLIAEICELLAEWVEEKSLTGIEASDLVAVVSTAMLQNPILFVEAEANLAAAVIQAVHDGAGASKTGLFLSATLIDTVRALLTVLALHGADWAKGKTLKALTASLTGLVTESLDRASEEIGRGLSIPQLPQLLGGLTAALVQGKISTVDSDDAQFQLLVTQTAQRLIL